MLRIAMFWRRPLHAAAACLPRRCGESSQVAALADARAALSLRAGSTPATSDGTAYA